MMYDELIELMRYCANDNPVCEKSEACPFYNQAEEDYGYYFCVERMLKQAADAIEDLQKQLHKSEADNTNLTGWLAEEHAKKCPHYIRNVHDRGDDSLCDKWVCEIKSLPKWIPVTERLPEAGKKVLVFAYGYDTITARMCKKTEDGYPVFECKGYDGIYREMARAGRISHWMPLPEKPEVM